MKASEVSDFYARAVRQVRDDCRGIITEILGDDVEIELQTSLNAKFEGRIIRIYAVGWELNDAEEDDIACFAFFVSDPDDQMLDDGDPFSVQLSDLEVSDLLDLTFLCDQEVNA